VLDGTIKGSHFATVGQTKGKGQSSIETLLAPYNVPKEVIKMIEDNQQVAELETLKEQIQPPTPKLKQKYRGIRQDGAASEFLQKNYAKEIETGILNSANLKHTDLLLLDALVREIAKHNSENPENSKHLSDYLMTKKTILQKNAELVAKIFPDIPFKDLASFFLSVSYSAKETDAITR
jgi:predicted P-loop ATPase